MEGRGAMRDEKRTGEKVEDEKSRVDVKRKDMRCGDICREKEGDNKKDENGVRRTKRERANVSPEGESRGNGVIEKEKWEKVIGRITKTGEY